MTDLVAVLNRLVDRKDLTIHEAQEVLDFIFTGQAEPFQVAAFLTAMRAKGETAAEVAGLAASLRHHASAVSCSRPDLVDVVGTGGAKIKTFNVSSASAIVAAGAGATVAKHGNRGITSRCGAADVLETLGVKIDLGPAQVARCIDAVGIGFMFAPMFHPAMKHVQPIRKALGFRTVFNILGPLANPAGAPRQLLGVADPALIDLMVEALGLLGVERALVVHSEGLDELGTFGPCQAAHLHEGRVERLRLDPRDLGLARARVADLQVRDAQDSAATIRGVLAGQITGPKRDIVVLNSGAALWVAGRADDLAGGMELARQAIDDGRALETLEQWARLSQEV